MAAQSEPARSTRAWQVVAERWRGQLSSSAGGYYPEKKTPDNATKALDVHVLREAGCTSIKVPRVDKATGQAVLMDFEVGGEPASVAAYRAAGPTPPAADLTGIY